MRGIGMISGIVGDADIVYAPEFLENVLGQKLQDHTSCKLCLSLLITPVRRFSEI